MANFVLTEEQYNRAIAEGIVSNGPKTKTVVDGNGSPNVGAAVNNAVKNTKDDTIEVTNFGNNGNSNSTSLYESRLISKKELKENRLKKLRENSKIISVKDIFGI